MKLEAVGSDGSQYCYTESIWTGKRSLIVNGQILSKLDRRTFIFKNDDGTTTNYRVVGSFLMGVKIVTDNGETIVLAQNKGYEWVLIFMPFVGLFVSLFFSGWIWAAIACSVAMVLNATLVRKLKNPAGKVFACLGISLGLNLVAFIITLLIAGTLFTLFPDLITTISLAI